MVPIVQGIRILTSTNEPVVLRDLIHDKDKIVRVFFPRLAVLGRAVSISEDCA